MQKQEEFRQIDEFPDHAVSDRGTVKNVITGRIMTHSFNGYEYTVGIRWDDKQRRRSVRRLVAKAFVEGQTRIFNTPTLRDGDRKNLCATNIVWRPLWFARAHISQFEQKEEWWYDGPVIDKTTNIMYDTIYEAGVVLGCLLEDIYQSLIDESRVFPDGNVFDFV